MIYKHQLEFYFFTSDFMVSFFYMKKDKKIAKYFDNLAKNYYHKNIKVDNDFFKFIANKINTSEIYCKSEYRKAQVKLYNRISYFKKNKSIIELSDYTGISISDLLNFFLLSDLKLTKKGVETLKRFYNLSMSAEKPVKNKETAAKNKTDDAPVIMLSVFLNYLKKQLKYPLRTDGRINVRTMPDGTVFYSNNAVYQALKTYFKSNRSQDIGSPVDAKKYMVGLVNQLRDAGLLAKKINKGYYSNSFTVKDGDGRFRREFGIFIKK